MNSNWQNRILQHAASPPEGAWKNIAGMLDEESGFAARLTAYEAIAPATAQENIFALLDAAENNYAFPQRIYDFECAAPAAAWPNIVTALDENAAKVIPLETNTRKRSSFYLRAAAAIAVIAVISTAIWILNRNDKRTDTGEIVHTKNNTVQSQETAGINPDPAQKNTPVSAEQNSTTKNISRPVYVQNNDITPLAQNPADGKKDKLQTITGETPEDITAINSPNSYITISGPDGTPVRVSSKFSGLISYLTEKKPEVQENIDIIIKESAKWKATFAAWRDKMINNAAAPSLSNFMDIIELSDVLEEKK